MKTLYLVRHAESEGNAGPLQQGPTTPLSEQGHKQKALVAERFRNIPVDVLLASPQTRAKHTAEAIGEAVGYDIRFDQDLVERKRPSSTIGIPKDSPEFLEAERLVRENYHDLSWRHSDEENFLDLRGRAIRMLDKIERMPEDHVLIVTHGLFMRMLVMCAIHKEALTSHLFWDFFVGSYHSNTGITILKQSQFQDNPPHWQLRVWNDHAHLGNL